MWVPLTPVGAQPLRRAMGQLLRDLDMGQPDFEESQALPDLQARSRPSQEAAVMHYVSLFQGRILHCIAAHCVSGITNATSE